jgi:hypothetical protein
VGHFFIRRLNFVGFFVRSSDNNKYKNWRKAHKPEKLDTVKNIIEDSIENSGRIYVKRD